MSRTVHRHDPVHRFASWWPAVLVLLLAVATLVLLIAMLATFPLATT
jgi:hypothetical protein